MIPVQRSLLVVLLLTEFYMNGTQCTETYKNGKSEQKTDKKNVPQIIPLYLLEVLYKSQRVQTALFLFLKKKHEKLNANVPP